ncbi:hypothetical protein O8W32_02540 [Methanomassiliicoccales archaeon LGM-DZ1]|nr:hypothetical protein O8W32_02540 [Methanomassiliicoccales archaeon LGM-DZ1]
MEPIEMNNDAVTVSGNEVLFKEMDLLQNCISRMAENSFRCKEWAVALAVAVLGLCYSDFGSEFLAVVSVFPLMFLWYMDFRYLSLEKKFRDRYAFVIHSRPEGNCRGLFELDPKMFDEDTEYDSKTEKSIFRSWSELYLYIGLIFIVLASGIILHFI